VIRAACLEIACAVAMSAWAHLSALVVSQRDMEGY